MARKPPETDEDYRWLSLPAIYCDTYTIDFAASDTTSMVRLVLGDYVSKEYTPFFRASVIIPTEVVRELLQSLQELLNEADEKTPTEKQKTTKT